MDLKNIIAQIEATDKTVEAKARKKWDIIAKPLYGLGFLEDAIVRIAAITGSIEVDIAKRCVVPLCADNGVVAEGVTQTGQDVTAIVTRNFLDNKASVCKFAQIAHCDVIPVDLGVVEDIDDPRLLKNKFSNGTANICHSEAMSRETALSAIIFGIELVGKLKNDGYKLIATGEMGIGNTTTSSAVASVLLNTKPELVTSYGAGLSKEGLKNKINAVSRAILLNKPDPRDPVDIIAKIGGYDIAGMCGMFLGGALHKTPVLIDGFISSVAALCAARLCPSVTQYLLASHTSRELAAQLILDELQLRPLICAGLCLGEGTGAVAAIPLLDMANAVYREMPTFEDTNIEAYQRLV